MNNKEHPDRKQQHNHQGVQLSHCGPTGGDSGDDCMKNTRRTPHYQALRGIQWQGPKNSGFFSGLSEKVALYCGIQNLRDNITDLSALWTVLRWHWIIKRQEVLMAIRFSYCQDIEEDSSLRAALLDHSVKQSVHYSWNHLNVCLLELSGMFLLWNTL